MSRSNIRGKFRLARLHCLALTLACAALLVVCAPVTLMGQTEAADQGSTDHAATNQAATDQAKARPEAKDEAEQTNVYRHSPTVQWISKTTHLPLETTAKALEFINFAVIALAVGIPLFKVLPKAMRKRSETLSSELESARTATSDANARLKAVEEKLAGLDQEIGRIRLQVDQEMRDDEARIKASIGEESARVVAAAEQDISIAAAHAQRELKQFAANLAIDRALERLTITSEVDHELIAEFSRGLNTESKSVTGGRN